jgi:DNA-binding MarR family transcriptional regulator
MPSKQLNDYAFWAEFRYQVRLWMRISEEAALEAGLSPQQHQVLLAIKGFPGSERPRIADLAERMQIRHHSMVGLLDRMEMQGFVRREPLGGGRGVSIVLTGDGERVLAEVSRVLRPKLRAAGRRLVGALAPLTDVREGRAGRKSQAGTGESRRARPQATARVTSRKR